MIWTPLVVIAIIGLLALVPYLLERRRIDIGLLRHEAATGKLVRLSQGVTHFTWHGKSRGKVIVAVHGLTTPSIVWNTMLPGLVALGYRVLTYDLYGRGLSDTPTGPQDRHYFLRQLQDLLQHEGVEDDVTLLGYSMGGTIVTAFAQEQPHRVAQVLLVAPSGIVTRESKFSKWCRRLPYLGDWVHGVFGASRIKKQMRNADVPPSGLDVVNAQREQLKQRGYLPSILSSRRNLLQETTEQALRKFVSMGIPVAVVWGDMDQVVPVHALGLLASWNKETRQEVIKGADHGLPFTHGAEVSDAFRDLLKVPNP